MFRQEKIAHLLKKKTPYYFYDIPLLEKTLQFLKDAAKSYNYHVHYALKANNNDHILNLINKYQFGADCVSGYEVKKALKSGFKTQDIVFAGVGKTDSEINLAIKEQIFSINCESLEELVVINQLAKKLNKIAQVAIRINPNVDAHTHRHITTGKNENKFGISTERLSELIIELNKLKNIKINGLHFHIGSQITDFEAFKLLCLKVNEITSDVQNKGINIGHINLGGGLGIDYSNPDKHEIADFQAYFKVFHQNLNIDSKIKIHFELGRSIVAQCGTLIAKVLFVKKGINTDFIVLDAGMNDLIRPALYQSVHSIENISSNSKEYMQYDVVGPVCESSDCFAKKIKIKKTNRFDLIAIRSVGAYGQVMASNYNLRPKTKSYF